MSHSSRVKRAYQMWLEEQEPDHLTGLFRGFVKQRNVVSQIEKENLKQITDKKQWTSPAH